MNGPWRRVDVREEEMTIFSRVYSFNLSNILSSPDWSREVNVLPCPRILLGAWWSPLSSPPHIAWPPTHPLGGYLAELTTEEESELVMSVISDEVNYWIGLTDFADGDFLWFSFYLVVDPIFADHQLSMSCISRRSLDLAGEPQGGKLHQLAEWRAEQPCWSGGWLFNYIKKQIPHTGDKASLDRCE